MGVVNSSSAFVGTEFAPKRYPPPKPIRQKINAKITYEKVFLKFISIISFFNYII